MLGTDYLLRGRGGDAKVHKGFNAQLLAVNYKASVGHLKDSGPREMSATVPVPESQVGTAVCHVTAGQSLCYYT